jgi:multiple sugar transport system substrate-binding protein
MPVLRVALIGGPQYDVVEAHLNSFTAATGIAVEVAHRGDHPALNAAMARALPSGEPLDLISTHSKYAPSQSRWLRPLDDVADASAFEPRALDLCSFGSRLLCVPRMVDVRLLWLNRDAAGDRAAPADWDATLDLASALTAPGRAGYAFPGRESGLFGTFFELTAAAGGELFDEHARPAFNCAEARWALDWLVEAHRVRRVTPAGLPGWHYDEVSEAFRSGAAAMIGDWPAFYGLLYGSPVDFAAEPHRYPRGRSRRCVYAGVHGYAIPASCTYPTEASLLLAHLTSRDSLAVEAAQGAIPPRTDVPIPVSSERDTRRADLLRATVAQDMLTFPPLPGYPEIEDAGWRSLRAALVGEASVDEALTRVQAEAERVLA